MNAFALLSMVVGGGPASAVAPAPAEIIVTGERVPRRLRDTPSSVMVFTGDRIARHPGDERIEDLLGQVPNIQFGTGGQGATIRGQDSTGPLQDLPAFLGGNRPRVTLQVDGRAASYNEYVFGATPLWDVAQVEIFRTPQTTTQGRNAIAGAIFVRTADPQFSWSGRARAITGDLARRQLSAVVGGPVAGDVLAFRLAGDVKRGRPSVAIGENMVGGDPTRDDHEQARLKLLLNPGAKTRIVATLSHTRGYAPQVERAEAPFARRRDPGASYGVFRTRVDAATIEARSEVGRSMTVAGTLSVGDASIRRFAPLLLGQARNHARDRSLEALVDWRPGDGVRLHGGAHLLGVDLDQSIALFAFSGTGRFTDRQRSSGLFGEVEWRPLPSLTLTAGLRRQRDRQDRVGTRLFDGRDLVRFRRNDAAWLPRLSLTYAIGEQFSVGALVQRAFNAGGATLNFATGQTDQFGAERLWNSELFARGSFAGGALRFDANLFRNDMRQAQRAQLRQFRALTWAEILNLPRARAHGAEASLDWRVNRRWSVAAAAGLLATRVRDGGPVYAALTGKQFQRAPRVTATGSIEWRPAPALRLSARAHYHSAYFSDDANTPELRVGAATTIDADASIERGGTRLFAYARNLFDRLHVTFLYDPRFATLDPPRELGIGISQDL